MTEVIIELPSVSLNQIIDRTNQLFDLHIPLCKKYYPNQLSNIVEYVKIVLNTPLTAKSLESLLTIFCDASCGNAHPFFQTINRTRFIEKLKKLQSWWSETENLSGEKQEQFNIVLKLLIQTEQKKDFLENTANTALASILNQVTSLERQFLWKDYRAERNSRNKKLHSTRIFLQHIRNVLENTTFRSDKDKNNEIKNLAFETLDAIHYLFEECNKNMSSDHAKNHARNLKLFFIPPNNHSTFLSSLPFQQNRSEVHVDISLIENMIIAYTTAFYDSQSLKKEGSFFLKTTQGSSLTERIANAHRWISRHYENLHPRFEHLMASYQTEWNACIDLLNIDAFFDDKNNTAQPFFSFIIEYHAEDLCEPHPVYAPDGKIRPQGVGQYISERAQMRSLSTTRNPLSLPSFPRNNNQQSDFSEPQAKRARF